MKPVKSFFAFILIFAVLLSLCACVRRVRDSSSVWLDFELNEERTGYEVTGSNIAGEKPGVIWQMVDVVIPSEYRGKPVVKIGIEAFKDSQILASVTIPDTVEFISGSAFSHCTALTSLHLPKNVKHLGGWSFDGCTSLSELTVDPANPYFTSVDNVIYTKDGKELVLYAPANKQSTFEIPDGVVSINRYSMWHCSALENISIPSSVTDISYESIMFCDSLRGVDVSENNAVYKSIDGNLYSRDGTTFLRFYSVAEPTALVLPQSVTTIDRFAAYYSHNLTEITIPAGVTYIGDSAFSQCPDLSKATFENTSGWKLIPTHGKFASPVCLSPSDFESPEKNATYLTDDYYDHEWEAAAS